ncbi:MAG: helix-turn-helix domain-containing protein [Coriobacteriia bacterium]|nr:helix-turn-helix domain-containing protein [Coriobacteriia bacterium]
MNIDSLLQYATPFEIQQGICKRLVLRRKEQKLSQVALANKAGVSLGSLKRFEATGEISLTSLTKLAYALGYQHELEELFSQKHYRTIEDVIRDARA